jgi:hypothetical protein
MTLAGRGSYGIRILTDIMPQFERRNPGVKEIYFVPKWNSPSLGAVLNANPDGFTKSGVNPALPDGVGHAIDGQHVGRDAVVHVMGLGVAHHILKRRHHDVF